MKKVSFLMLIIMSSALLNAQAASRMAPRGVSGIIGLLPLVVIIVIIFSISKGKKSKTAFLVLKKFEMDSTLNKKILLDIEGRKAGLISWLLHIMGINPKVSLKVFKDEIIFEEGSLSGETTWAIPAASISATQTGYYKPWGFILFSIIFFVSAILVINQFIQVSIILFIIAIIFFFAYKLNKSITILFESKGSRLFGLSFKSSVIENVSIDLEKAKIAMEIVRNVSK